MENVPAGQKLLQRLEELLAAKDTNPDLDLGEFSAEEIQALKKVAARERAYEAIGAFGTSLKTFLTYVGFFIGVYLAVKAGIIEWIKGLALR